MDETTEIAAMASIVRLVAVAAPGPLLSEIDAIFFEASGRAFNTEPERQAFRERWLGRYLEHDREQFFVASTESGTAIGYLAGSFDNPAHSPRFADLDYYRSFAAFCGRFPAHLHINFTADWRGRRIGSRLIEAFARYAAAAGVPGVHVVTGKGARNVGFYGRNGFHLAGETTWNGRPIVFLGRRLP